MGGLRRGWGVWGVWVCGWVGWRCGHSSSAAAHAPCLLPLGRPLQKAGAVPPSPPAAAPAGWCPPGQPPPIWTQACWGGRGLKRGVASAFLSSALGGLGVSVEWCFLWHAVSGRQLQAQRKRVRKGPTRIQQNSYKKRKKGRSNSRRLDVRVRLLLERRHQRLPGVGKQLRRELGPRARLARLGGVHGGAQQLGDGLRFNGGRGAGAEGVWGLGF